MSAESPLFSATGRGPGELSALLHRVYEAALDERLWPGALQAMAASLRAPRALPPTPNDMLHLVASGPEALAHAPLCPQDRRWLELLLPHLLRAWDLGQRLQRAPPWPVPPLGAFDALPVGILWLNADAQVLQANAAAQQLLTRGDGLACRADGVLMAQALQAERPALAEWLRRRPQGPEAQGFGGSATYLARRTRPEQVYCLQCHALESVKAWPTPQRATVWMVVISNPARIEPPSAERLKGLYGLTQAETRVAHQLAFGLGAKEVAQVLGTSPETVRTQAKSIYQKMQINSQSELVRLVLSLGQARV